IYARNQGGADNWGQVKKLTASDVIPSSNFGNSVAISDDTVVVGVPVRNSTPGAAFVYSRNRGGADNWGQVEILTASDGTLDDEFGISVGISGDTVVAGAAFKNSSTGAAYIFADQCNQWVQVSHPVANDGAADDNFGISVGISGDTVIVGGCRDDVGGDPNTG